jgi:outer membrane protein OmpA-like peptidoglycan-associated protein
MQLFLRLLLLTLISCGPLFAQDHLRTELFGEADKVMSQAKAKNAPLYAPVSFQKGTQYYKEGEDLYQRGRDLEQIREKLKNAAAYFAKALDESKTGEVTFSGVLAARNDADSAGASKSAAELWGRAEVQFNKAARELEDGETESANRGAAEAQATYRAAELEAVKSNYLSPARVILAKDDEEGVKDEAPKTLAKAHGLAVQVEALLKQNRYDADEARQLAQQARYEAAHAGYLFQTIRKMKKEEKTFEDAMLAAEDQFQRLAVILGVQPHFDNGLEGPVTDAIAALKERDAKALKDAEQLRQAGETIAEKDVEIENLRKQVSSMEGRVGSLTESEKELQRTLGLKHQEEETIRQVSSMFAPEEGNVLRDGDNIIIRLYGLTFPVGKNTIEPEYYSLLTKVQDAIKKFPKCGVTIEGHTDSQGSDELNQTLSESRAKAVAEYLMANMGVEFAVNHQGYGESRPVASNDSPEGRAKNRRIDVVITPESAPPAK